MKKIANEVGRKSLGLIFNDIIKERLQKIPMPFDELVGYLNAVSDIYCELCEEKKFDKKKFFDKEILELLGKLERGEIVVKSKGEKK